MYFEAEYILDRPALGLACRFIRISTATVPVTRLRRVTYQKETRDLQLAYIGWRSGVLVGFPFRFGTSKRHPPHISISVEFNTKHFAEEYGSVPDIVAEFFVAAAVMWWTGYLENLIPRKRSFNIERRSSVPVLIANRPIQLGMAQAIAAKITKVSSV